MNAPHTEEGHGVRPEERPETGPEQEPGTKGIEENVQRGPGPHPHLSGLAGLFIGTIGGIVVATLNPAPDVTSAYLKLGIAGCALMQYDMWPTLKEFVKGSAGTTAGVFGAYTLMQPQFYDTILNYLNYLS